MVNTEEPVVELAGLEVEPFPATEVQSKFDMTIYARERSEEIQFNLVYNADLFNQGRMAEMLRQYEKLLSEVVEHPAQSILAYSLLTERARKLLPNPVEPLGSDWMGSVHERFSEQARRLPDHVAITDPHDDWTYEELNTRSNQLAHYLLERGIGREDIVAIHAHRSASLAWALLGILKAGAAFLILDPAYPGARLAEYVRAAKPKGLVVIGAASEVATEVELALQEAVCVALPGRSDIEGFLGGYSTAEPKIAVGADDLAYVSFTSGSTGEPKGILGRHGPLTHFLPWQAEKFGLDESDRFSLLSGLSHDPLHREMFTAFWVGGTVCVPDPDVTGAGERLAEWMAEQRVTFAHLTPPLGRILSATAKPDCQLPSLRYAFVVGDRLTWIDVDRLRGLAPNMSCVNYYGSTETQRAVSYFEVAPERNNGAVGSIVPVGCGMPDVQLLVMTQERRLAGLGEVGEIYMRSPHLALGYLGDGSLTQARFITNPFTGEPGDRLYRSGDLGRYLHDGNVEILGRSDGQVKIRGFRVEPGEIESVLKQHPAVRDAAVVGREDAEGDQRLVAYLVIDPHAPKEQELRRFVRRKLPDYMTPAAFVFLDVLPLTPNGKLDHRRLPAPDRSRAHLEETFIAPRTPVEAKLARIWAEVLKLNRVDMRDNFFDLGGHSLLATQVIARARGAFRIEIPLRALFEKPTVEELAATIAHWTAVESNGEELSNALADLESLSEEEASSLLIAQETNGKEA
jgi:amino acid adenylation domain-containing protein